MPTALQRPASLSPSSARLDYSTEWAAQDCKELWTLVRVVWKEFGVSAPVPSAVQDLIKSLGSLNVDLTRRLQTTRAISAHMKGLGWGPGLRVRGPSGRTYSSDKYQGGTSVEIELRAC